MNISNLMQTLTGPKSVGVLTLAAIASVAGAANAVPLSVGSTAVPVGQTAAHDPSLNGKIVASRSIPFRCAWESGTLDNWVVQEGSGTYAIYYQIHVDAGSPQSVTSFTVWPYPLSPSTIDADYRLDLPGDVAPNDVDRNGTLIRFHFYSGNIDPGLSSYPVYLRSEGFSSYYDGGSLDVDSCQTLTGVFVPP